MSNRDNELPVDDLIQLLDDPDQVVRIHAGLVLGARGPRAEPAVPALVRLLTDGAEADRKLAAITLGKIGPAAADAVPALLEAADADSLAVAGHAERALDRIIVDAAEAA